MDPRDYIVLEMPEGLRRQRIGEQAFYNEQAFTRLLIRFDDIKSEADDYAERWSSEHEHLFNPYKHDPEDFGEAAWYASIDFYLLLERMRMQTRLSLVAGMYHQWDKYLREWLVQQLTHRLPPDRVNSVIWKANAGQLNELLTCLHVHDGEASYVATLDICRLVVNVYKHGEGQSCKELNKRNPSFFKSPLSELMDTIDWPVTHADLKISDNDLQEFSEAIITFWEKIPATVTAGSIKMLPEWFEKQVS